MSTDTTAKELKLHLGCGDVHKDDYINIDIRPCSAVDLIADISKPLPFAPGSATKIEAYDVLEHFSHEQARPLLTIWLSYLKTF